MVKDKTISTENIAKPNMKGYYDTRLKLRELYANGVQMNPRANDLCSDILQLRDKNRCIESVNVDTCEYTIEIELEEGTSYDKSLKIQKQVSTIIDNYIKNNIGCISDIEKEAVESVSNNKFYDNISVGNYIRFNL